jgi:8-oxo-dGTP pyrophosphatase MutT (NUDIX family)
MAPRRSTAAPSPWPDRSGALTRGHVEPPRLIVVGVDALGAEVARLVLGHGDDPTALLAVHGWEVRLARDVMSSTVEKHVLTMTFVVEPLAPAPLEPAPLEPVPLALAPLELGAPLRRDQDLAVAEGEVPERYQRVAAYAFVNSPRGVLMTQFSDRTNAQGQWGLPGGGLEAEEAPDRAVVREVWEESGQVIEVSGLALVHTSHWVGRAPAGRLEDFHAVRVVYRASCHAPTEPVVHDVGGTTAAAAWVPTADLDRLEVTPGWRTLLSALSVTVMAPEEADGPEHHEQGTDADDRARPQP